MMAHQAQRNRPPESRPGAHRLLPIAGIAVVALALLAHLAGGAALMHLGPGAALANLVGLPAVSGSALAVGLVAVITLKLLLVFGARRWLRRR